MKKYLLAMLLTGCASTTTTPTNTNNDELRELHRQLNTLRHYIYSSAYVDAVHGCELSGRICSLQKKELKGCQQKTEECVILNYRQWEAVKKNNSWDK